jgi:hypothetical protein
VKADKSRPIVPNEAFKCRCRYARVDIVRRSTNAAVTRFWCCCILVGHTLNGHLRVLNSVRHASLKSRNGSAAGPFTSSRKSEKLRFGLKYVSMIK